MSRALTRALVAFAAGFVMVAIAACGGGGKKEKAAGVPVSGQHKGGTLKVQSVESFEHLDPGQSYFQEDYEVVFAAQRPLYSYEPANTVDPAPDIAASKPVVSIDHKTVTVKLKKGIRYSPGTVTRDVQAKDIKYAFERGLTTQVANGYWPTYFGDIIGAKAFAAGKAKDVSGIETPDKYTVVYKLSKPTGLTTVAKALVLPLSVPVPKEYAQKFDKSTPSKYDSDPTIQAFTGPYVIKSYAPGKSLVLVRNRNWNPKTDYRPAYVDRVEWTNGVDGNVSGRQILTGRSLINGDSPPAPILKLAATKYKKQLLFGALGNRYVALNTTLKPFDDINIRRAVGAGLDRRAMQLTRGGAAAGDIATHFIPPTSPGFKEAGGFGTTFDWLKKPDGDPALAKKYLQKAGFKSGKYSGPPITMIGDNGDPAAKTAQVVLNSLQKLGFKVNFRSVEHSAFYSKFCNDRKALEKINVCANYGFLPDFSDPSGILNPTFNGENIVPINNSNASLLNVPSINKAMDKALLVVDPARSNKLWAELDKKVTETAASIPWFWDKQPSIESKNVQGVLAQWNAVFDLSFTSLK